MVSGQDGIKETRIGTNLGRFAHRSTRKHFVYDFFYVAGYTDFPFCGEVSGGKEFDPPTVIMGESDWCGR